MVVLLLGSAACSSASSDAGDPSDLVVTDARTAVDGDPNQASIYLTVRNAGGRADRLTGADAGEGPGMLHESGLTGGVASMKMVDELEVPAGGELVLAPGGAHLMIAVPDGLAEGDEFDVTLTFAEAGEVVAAVEVVSADEVLG